MITTDDCRAYADVFLNQYGETVVPPPTGKPGRQRKPHKRWPSGSAYATVNKTYKKGTVVAVERTLVFGTNAELAAALAASSSSATINTSFVERQNGTDRRYNARKARKTYQFSKDLRVHLAVTWWGFFCYNFHHTNRSLRVRSPDGSFRHRTPAMAIGISMAPMSVADILMMQSTAPPPCASTTIENFGRARAA